MAWIERRTLSPRWNPVRRSRRSSSPELLSGEASLKSTVREWDEPQLHRFDRLAVFRAMYSTCLFCNSSLGANDQIPAFPVGRRLAFDPARGRLWVVCTRCGRWNLSPLEERWEAIDECERLFRGTRLRYSTDNVGLARIGEHLELVRIGPALLPEIASWRYGARIEQHAAPTNGKRHAKALVRRGASLPRWIARRAAAALAGYATTGGLRSEEH